MPTRAKSKKAESPPKARGKQEKGLNEKIVAMLKRRASRTEADGVMEVSMLRKNNLSAVRHILKMGIEPFDALAGADTLPGLPFGRIVELYGPEQSGKTAFAILAAVRAQMGQIYEVLGKKKFKKVNPADVDITVAFFDNEGTLDENHNIEVDGVKLDCVLLRCDTVTQMFKAVDDIIDAKRAVEKTTKRMQFLVVVVDTIAGTSSKEELKQEWGKEDYSRMPKQLRQGFRVLMRKITRHNVLFIATNQVGDSFKQKQKGKGPVPALPQESDYTSAGGKAVKYYARLRIFVQVAKEEYFLARQKKGARKQFADGFIGQLYCKKNSQTNPGRGARFVLMYGEGGGLNNLYSKLEHLIFMKFAENDEDGGVTFLFSQNGVPLTTFGDSLATTLEEDDDAEEDDDDDDELLGDEDEDDDGEDKPKRKTRTKNPYLEVRAQWPAFYAAHKADFDAFWAKCVQVMFEARPTQALPGSEGTHAVVQDDDSTDAADLEGGLEENSETPQE